MKTIPKYIKNKCCKIDEYMSKANTLRLEIEEWAKNNGVDIYSDQYREYVCVEPLCPYGIEAKFLEEIKNQISV